jgi:hypothetical protein
MKEDIEIQLNKGIDFILDQLEHGNTIDGLKKGRIWMGFEQVKEWKSKYGYKFHIYSNDHLIDNKPHFHLIKNSEDVDCRFFFDGNLYDCKKENQIKKKVREALLYFLSKEKNQNLLISFWSLKNPELLINS